MNRTYIIFKYQRIYQIIKCIKIVKDVREAIGC